MKNFFGWLIIIVGGFLGIYLDSIGIVEPIIYYLIGSFSCIIGMGVLTNWNLK